MMHVPILTLVLTIFVASTVLAKASSAHELTCDKGSVSNAAGLVATRCCGGQPYRPGYQRALEEHVAICNKEPVDKAAVLADSQWAFYSCLMEHLLGEGHEVTFKSFAQAMTGNMTEPEKAKIMDIVEKLDGTRSNLDWSNKDQIQSTWTAYFDAEFEVCNDVLKTAHDVPEVNATSARDLFWEPSFQCKDVKMPFVIPFKGNFMDELSDCRENIKQQLKLNGTLMRELVSVCILITTGALKKEDLGNDGLDVDRIIDAAFPKTLSAQVKSDAIKSGKLTLSKLYGVGSTESFSDMAKKIAALGRGSEMVAKFEDSDRKLYINVVTLDVLATAVVGGIVRNCYPSGI